jgi:hypothetical protein
VKGPNYPSETFRVLKKNEIARFGEFRTARLVLAAYDQITAKSLGRRMIAPEEPAQLRGAHRGAEGGVG